MIEVYKIETLRSGITKEILRGIIDGRTYLTEDRKPWEYLDGNVARYKDGYPLLILHENGKITLNEDWAFEHQGYLKENEICAEDGDVIFRLNKEKGQIEDVDSLSIFRKQF